jgi:diadenosine tetraphosphate (Ap4A) HIT family hydrolase
MEFGGVGRKHGPAAGQVVPQLHFHVIPVEGPEDEVRLFMPFHSLGVLSSTSKQLSRCLVAC